jgi:hypothetical protein
LTFEDPEDRTIFSLLRLRLPKNKKINEDKQVLSLSSQNPPNPLYQGGIQTFSS